MPISKKVRLKRFCIDGEFEGILELAELPLRINKKQPIELKIGRMEFPSNEIEKCSIITN